MGSRRLLADIPRHAHSISRWLLGASAALVTLSLGCQSAAANGGLPTDACRPRDMGQAASALVVPLLRVVADWKRGGYSDPLLLQRREDLLKAIVKDRSPDGDEALAYVLTLYLGEATGEILKCEALARGARMAGPVRSASSCRPTLPGLVVDPELLGPVDQASSVLDGLAKKRVCEKVDY